MTKKGKAREGHEGEGSKKITDALIQHIDIMVKEYVMLATLRIRDYDARTNDYAGNTGEHMYAHMNVKVSKQTLDDLKMFRDDFINNNGEISEMLRNIIGMWRCQWWKDEALPALTQIPAASDGTSQAELNNHVKMVEALVSKNLCPGKFLS